MQREIDDLATSIKRPKKKRGLSVDFCDSGSDGSHFGIGYAGYVGYVG